MHTFICAVGQWGVLQQLVPQSLRSLKERTTYTLSGLWAPHYGVPARMLGSLTNPQITAKLLVSPNNFPCGSETRSESHVLFVRESYMSWQLSTTGDGEMKRSVCFRTKNRCSLCVSLLRNCISHSQCVSSCSSGVCFNLKALSELDLRQKLSASSWLWKMLMVIVVWGKSHDRVLSKVSILLVINVAAVTGQGSCRYI